MRVAVLGLLAACSSPTEIHLSDGGPNGPFTYRLQVGFDSTRPDMPGVFIDGVATMTVENTYPTFTRPITHTVELRYADQVLATMPIVAGGAADCGTTGDSWTKVVQSVNALSSGDLRYQEDEWWIGDRNACVGDGFGLANCACRATERCAPRISRTEPLFTKMACVPIGPKAASDPCTLTDDPAGAYDDCGENLVCLAGTCTPFCSPTIPAEYPPEVKTRCP